MSRKRGKGPKPTTGVMILEDDEPTPANGRVCEHDVPIREPCAACDSANAEEEMALLNQPWIPEPPIDEDTLDPEQQRAHELAEEVVTHDSPEADGPEDFGGPLLDDDPDADGEPVRLCIRGLPLSDPCIECERQST